MRTERDASGWRYLPVGFDLAGRKCLVVGGGKVARRKVDTLVGAGAAVVVVSPAVCEAVQAHVSAGTVAWVRGRYEPGHLDGCALVVAATDDPPLNTQIRRDADARLIPACVVAPGRESRLIFPAIHRHDDLTIAVISDGKSCVRSRDFRNELADMLSARTHFGTLAVAPFGPPPATLPRDAGTAVLAASRGLACCFCSESPRLTIQHLHDLLCEADPTLRDRLESVSVRFGADAYFRLLRVAAGLEGPRDATPGHAETLRATVSGEMPDGALKTILASVLADWDTICHETGLAATGDVDYAAVARADKLAFEKTIEWQSRQPGRARVSGPVRIGGRGSALSVYQLEYVQAILRLLAPGAELEVVTVDTPGDRDKSTPLPNVRDEDFFTRDLDDALQARRIDLAVHSAKDLPSRIRPGLCVAAVTPSYAPWDCLVTPDGGPLASLPAGARVGTSSARRRDDLLKLRPDLFPVEIRGNVPDRVRQLDEGNYDALVLAAVGLMRLDLGQRISQVFTVDEFPPTPGQGSLALMVRAEDFELLHLLHSLDLGCKKGLPWLQDEST